MVRRALTEKKGVVTNEDELISFEAVDDLDPDEVLKLLEWLGDHLLYFFVTSAGTMSRQAKEYSNELGLSNLSTSGSPDSASTTPSVRSEEHTSELQSLMRISYAVFCLKKKNIN